MDANLELATSIFPNSFQSIEEFVNGSLLLVDKPYGWTSFDVLNRIKYFVRNNINIPPNEQNHKRKFKIGHAGTLDPLATGLLIICTGKYTKLIDHFQGGIKQYTGTICLGKSTPSYDAETPVDREYPCEQITPDDIHTTAKSLLGEQWQKPPAYSAKHVDGQRAYISARKGESVIIPSALISINQFEITSIHMPEVEFMIECSKGTYIRSVANDFGRKLDSGSYLSSLRRISSLPFHIENSIALDVLLERLKHLMEVRDVK